MNSAPGICLKVKFNDIIQDRHGFIWIATLDGLYRYDGYEYKAYLSDGQKVYKYKYDSASGY